MMMKRLLTALTAVALVASLGTVASAADRPVLRADVVVSDDIVRLSHLVDGVPADRDGAVFRAPDLGTTGIVAAGQIVEAATRLGVSGVETLGLSQVSVTRASRAVAPAELQDAVTQAIRRQSTASPDTAIDFQFDASVRTLHIEPNTTAPVEVSALRWSPITGRFEATITVADSLLLTRSPVKVTGTATETVEILVYGRPLARGEIVRTADLVVERRSRADMPREGAGAAGDVVGKSVRRAVRAGQPVITADLTRPEMVTRNQPVMLIYEQPGMVLAIRAVAVESGAEGDVVSVMNPQSRRVVEAVVSGLGRVTVLARPSVAMN
ncbi:MAG: flagellar basal body P-ring formation chaperone FlgA [Labrys sp. (in: a-proteobacteria)]|jgi:flagella basal body P-ring formation protein FlgA